MSRQIHIPNFKSMCQKIAEKKLENWVDRHRVDRRMDRQTNKEET